MCKNKQTTLKLVRLHVPGGEALFIREKYEGDGDGTFKYFYTLL